MCAFRRRAHLPAGRYSGLAGDSLLIMSLSTIAWLPTGYTCHVRKSFVNGTITTTSTSSQSKDTPLVWGHIIISLIKLKGRPGTKWENNLAADRRWYFTAKRPTLRVQKRLSSWLGIVIFSRSFFEREAGGGSIGRAGKRESSDRGTITDGEEYSPAIVTMSSQSSSTLSSWTSISSAAALSSLSVTEELPHVKAAITANNRLNTNPSDSPSQKHVVHARD